MENNTNEVVTNIAQEPVTTNAPIEKKETNGFAIAGFVLSFLFSILGLIFSIMGLNRSKKTGTGRGLSIAGIVISAISMVLGVLMMLLVVPSLMAFIDGATVGFLETDVEDVIYDIELEYSLNPELAKSGNCEDVEDVLIISEYESCTYTIDASGNVTIDFVGTGEYDGYVVCDATGSNVEAKKGNSCN